MTQIATRIQKLITFSPQLYGNAQLRAEELGIPFAEYLRHLIISDVEKERSQQILLNTQANERLDQSYREISEGNFLDIDPSKENELEDFVGMT